MFTTTEVAEILGASKASIRVWLSEEGHPRFPNAQKFGRDWMIPESDLEGLPRGRGRGRPLKTRTEGAVSTATKAPDDGAPPAAIGEERAAKPAKKAGKKAGSKKG